MRKVEPPHLARRGCVIKTSILLASSLYCMEGGKLLAAVSQQARLNGPHKTCVSGRVCLCVFGLWLCACLCACLWSELTGVWVWLWDPLKHTCVTGTDTISPLWLKRKLGPQFGGEAKRLGVDANALGGYLKAFTASRQHIR